MSNVVLEKEIEKGMTVDDVLTNLPEFRPIAYYDKHLDAIRVQINDCSIWEERLDGIMTIYHANHHLNPDGLNDVVGFAIKGVRHLLNELNDDFKQGPELIKKYKFFNLEFNKLADAADFFGVSESMMSQVFSGRISPTKKMLDKVGFKKVTRRTTAYEKSDE